MVQLGTFGVPLHSVISAIGMAGITTPRALHSALAGPGSLIAALDAYALVQGNLAGFGGQYQAGDGYSAAALFGHLIRGVTQAEKPDLFSGSMGFLRLAPGRVPSPSSPVAVNGSFFKELATAVASEISANDRDGSEALFASRGIRNYILDMERLLADLARRSKYVLLRNVESGANLLMYEDPDRSGHEAFVRTSRLCWTGNKGFLGAGFIMIESGIIYFDGASEGLPTYDDGVHDPEGNIAKTRDVRIAPDVGLNAVGSAFEAAFPGYRVSKVPKVPKVQPLAPPCPPLALLPHGSQGQAGLQRRGIKNTGI